jgi:hypothetical protein
MGKINIAGIMNVPLHVQFHIPMTLGLGEDNA